jgi:hypothetical protein
MEIIGIYDAWNPFPDERIGLRIYPHLSGIRHLFYTNNTIHRKPPFC